MKMSFFECGVYDANQIFIRSMDHFFLYNQVEPQLLAAHPFELPDIGLVVPLICMTLH